MCTFEKKNSKIGIEIHLIVSDHPGGVLVKTSKKAQGAQSATPIIYATGTFQSEACKRNKQGDSNYTIYFEWPKEEKSQQVFLYVS